jgi:hypothetical protein
MGFFSSLLGQLAKATGFENLTREQLARFDRRCKKRPPNQDWKNPI